MGKPLNLELLRKLYGALMGGDAAAAEKAREKIHKLLKEHGYDFHDLPNLLSTRTSESQPADADTFGDEQSDVPNVPSPFDLIEELRREYIWINDDESLLAALWVLHTYVFDRFLHSPRLGIVSPFPGLGKSNFLAFLRLLVRKGEMYDDISPAALKRTIGSQQPDPPTVLLDELDTADLKNGRHPMTRTLNSGHRPDAEFSWWGGKEQVKSKAFSPIGFASIGIAHFAPATITRTLFVFMTKAPHEMPNVDITDNNVILMFEAVREVIVNWVAVHRDRLNRKPAIPEGLSHRLADNWRPLLSIADELGIGERAREAAVRLAPKVLEENPEITLLRDLRSIFYMHGRNGKPAVGLWTTVHIVPDLLALPESVWVDFDGWDGNAEPHNISERDINQMLRKLNPTCHAKPIRLVFEGRADQRRGLKAEWLEPLWKLWLDEEDVTPSQSSNVRRLQR
jgi:hypothetical protein